MTKQSKRTVKIAAGVLLAIIIIAAAAFWTSGSDGRNYRKHIDLAQHYMDELQYEQAIAEYEAAIAIDPNNAEAYQALAALYVQTGDYESAAEVLNRGIEQTESEELAVRFEETAVCVVESGSYYWVYKYDKNGILEEESGYYADGRIDVYNTYQDDGSGIYNDYSCIYEYDENRNCVRVSHYDRVDLESYYIVYEYDRDGNCVKESWTINGRAGSYVIYEYDENGNRVKGNGYYADGRLQYYDVYESGRVVSHMGWKEMLVGAWRPEGRLRATFIAYNDGSCELSGEDELGTWSLDGNALRLTNKYGKTESTMIVEVSEEKLIVASWDGEDSSTLWKIDQVRGESRDYREDGSCSTLYEYDENGNCVKHTDYDVDGTIIRYWIREYDTNGNLVERTEYDADGTIIEHELYEY